MNRTVLLVQSLLFLWFIGVVYSEHQKRHVHHKIILEDERPKRHHHHHHHNEHRQHKKKKQHNKGHDTHHYNHHVFHKHSFEDSSKDNSYEVFSKPKRHHKYSKPAYESSERSVEISEPYRKHHNHRHEWKPLLSYDDSSLSVTHRYESGSPKQDYTNKYFSQSAFNIDITTARTPSHQSKFDTSFYPPIDYFNQKSTAVPKFENIFEESKTVIDKKKPPTKINSTFFTENLRSYEVTEANTEIIKPFVINTTESNLFNTKFKPFTVNVEETKPVESNISFKRGRIVRGKRKHN